MEEDIKILEFWKEAEIGFPLLNFRKPIFPEREKQALENIITRYKELEEKLDNSRKANELLNKKNNELRWEKRTMYSKVANDIISKFNLGDDYIPKSKVKEKIEELEKYLKTKNVGRWDGFGARSRIEVLQELLDS